MPSDGLRTQVRTGPEAPHLDARTKGFPGRAGSLTTDRVGARGWNVLREDVPLPVCVIRESALEANGRRMVRFLEGSGAVLCPHGKTTMSAELFRRQLGDGCWGITLATCHQVQAARHHGIQRIFYANQLVGEAETRYVLEELERDPDFDFYCYVDSTDGVERLAARASLLGPQRPLQVVIECGYAGGRCGVRTPEGALTVAEAVRSASPRLRLAGVGGFEGLLQNRHPEERENAVRDFLGFMAGVARECDGRGHFDETGEVILTAGGSAFYDVVVETFAAVRLSRPTRVVIRSGCYLTHDSGLYAALFEDLLRRDPAASRAGLAFEPALEVWSHVLSTPEPGFVILSAGRRDFGHDAGFPRLILHARPGEDGRAGDLTGSGCEIVAVSDQHAHVRAPEGHDLRVGDLVALSPSHPCTTFDKWRAIYLVDSDYRINGVISTDF